MVTVPGKPDTVVDRDEHLRADATVAGFGPLRPIRVKLDPAGNASGQNDSTAMCVVTTRAEADKRGLTRLWNSARGRSPAAAREAPVTGW